MQKHRYTYLFHCNSLSQSYLSLILPMAYVSMVRIIYEWIIRIVKITRMMELDENRLVYRGPDKLTDRRALLSPAAAISSGAADELYTPRPRGSSQASATPATPQHDCMHAVVHRTLWFLPVRRYLPTFI